jgi:shikimate kinase
MNVVLIGFMCSGKSSVGRQLARRLGRTFFDTDELITKQVGSPVADIIRTKGEAAFRDIEKKVVQLVALSDLCVISTGGGVPQDADNMRELARTGEIVWLKVSPDVVLKRAGNLQSRPLIDPKDPQGSVEKRMKEREQFYSKASIAIDTDQLSIDDTVEKIITKIPSLSS